MSNALKTTLLLGLLTGLLMWVGQLVGGMQGLVLGLVLAAVMNLGHAGENAAMGFQAEVVGLERAGGLDIVGIVHEDGAEDETLRVQIRGKAFFEDNSRRRHDVVSTTVHGAQTALAIFLPVVVCSTYSLWKKREAARMRSSP